MRFVVDVIFGIPLEQKTHMLDTIKICAENKVRAKSHIFYPLPATRLEQIAIENGLFNRNIYGEDYHSKTILKYSKLHKARILFFHFSVTSGQGIEINLPDKIDIITYFDTLS